MGKDFAIVLSMAGKHLTPRYRSCYHTKQLLPVRWTRRKPIPRAGVFLPMRTLVLIDGQNLYRLAKRAYGPGPPYHWPSYDVVKLAHALASTSSGRTVSEIRFYTGVPDHSQDAFWHRFWNNKLRALQRQGVYAYRGRLNCNGQNVQEKGVDVSLAIDLVQATHQQSYEVAIIVSQDSDLAPAVTLARHVAQGQNRTVYFESAVPPVPGRRLFGIAGTTLTPIDKATYDNCLDQTDHR